MGAIDRETTLSIIIKLLSLIIYYKDLIYKQPENKKKIIYEMCVERLEKRYENFKKQSELNR